VTALQFGIQLHAQYNMYITHLIRSDSTTGRSARWQAHINCLMQHKAEAESWCTSET